MKFGFILLFIFGGMLGAQEYPTDTSEIYPSLLWEISGDSLQQPSYLYGTIHIIPKDSFFILPGLEKAIEKADRLALEINLDMNMGSMFQSALGMMMPGGKTLRSLLSKEDYTYVNQFIKDSLSTPIPFYQMIKPIFTSQQIASDYCSVGEQESYELYLSEKFKKADKPISGLETIKDQMTFLDDISLEDQAKGLVEAVRSPQAACEEFAKMVSIYRSQNLMALQAMTNEDESLEGHLDQLLDSRNRRWIGKINEMIQEETVLIAVGAGHLPGNQGVIELLKKEGYVVTPVK